MDSRAFFRALDLAEYHAKFFTDEFLRWLPDNQHFFQLFCERAEEVWQRGHRHYSGMCIIYVMRFHWDTKGDGTPFTITNTIWPDLTRLYVLLWPERNQLFEFIRDGTAFRGVVRGLLTNPKPVSSTFGSPGGRT